LYGTILEKGSREKGSGKRQDIKKAGHPLTETVKANFLG